MAKLIKRGTTDDNTQITQMATYSEPRRVGVIDRDTFEAKGEAQRIRERAQTQADELIAQATEQADAIRAEALEQTAVAHKAAETEGLKIGREAGVLELSQAALRYGLRIKELEAALVPQLTALSVGIAKKILGRELEFHPEAVVEIVKQVLGDKARQRREITLRVNPKDVQAIRQGKPELVELLSRTKEIAIREDASVSLHGVIIETEAGTIDAQLETQLAAFEAVLANVRGKAL